MQTRETRQQQAKRRSTPADGSGSESTLEAHIGEEGEEAEYSRRVSDGQGPKRRALFTPKEDELLRDLVREYGENCGVDGWVQIAEKLNDAIAAMRHGVPGSQYPMRTWKSCHQRWFKYLQSGLRSVRDAPLSYDERRLIMQLYEQIGRNPKTGKVQWKKICEEFSKVYSGRTSLDLKNYVNTVLNKAANASCQTTAVGTVLGATSLSIPLPPPHADAPAGSGGSKRRRLDERVDPPVYFIVPPGALPLACLQQPGAMPGGGGALRQPLGESGALNLLPPGGWQLPFAAALPQAPHRLPGQPVPPLAKPSQPTQPHGEAAPGQEQAGDVKEEEEDAGAGGQAGEGEGAGPAAAAVVVAALPEGGGACADLAGACWFPTWGNRRGRSAHGPPGRGGSASPPPEVAALEGGEDGAGAEAGAEPRVDDAAAAGANDLLALAAVAEAASEDGQGAGGEGAGEHGAQAAAAQAQMLQMQMLQAQLLQAGQPGCAGGQYVQLFPQQLQMCGQAGGGAYPTFLPWGGQLVCAPGQEGGGAAQLLLPLVPPRTRGAGEPMAPPQQAPAEAAPVQP